MKSFFKHFLLGTLILSSLLFTLSACSNPPDNSGNQVSAKQIINESIDKMEDMFTVEQPDLQNNQSANQTFALVLPNQDVDFDHERTSIIRGSCFSMYTAKYISNLEDFAIGTTYLDVIEMSGMTLEFLFRAEKVADGITANMEMHQSSGQNTSVSKIQLYFHYDYQNKTPLDTTIVSFSTSSLALAKLDYKTDEALSYEFDIIDSNYDAIKTALNQKSFDFDKFAENTYSRYKFAKMQVSLQTMQAYMYVSGQDGQGSSITQDQLKSFYNDVYSKVKNECVERDFLDKATAVSKVYYEQMYTYAMQEVMNLA